MYRLIADLRPSHLLKVILGDPHHLESLNLAVSRRTDGLILIGKHNN